MAFSFFNKQKQNESLTLLVDIGSASVGAGLVIIENGKTPRIVASVRESISFQEVLSSQRFLFAMNQALDRVLKSLQEKTKTTGAPVNIFCTLSSPWFLLKTRNLSVVKEKEFEITERILNQFIDEDIERLKDELKETLPPKDVRIIEKKVIHIKLNGYEIKNPYKQKTTRIELSATVGVSSSKVVQSIERKINNFFRAEIVHFGAFPVAAFSAIRDIFPTENNFIFIDITGEATDISCVCDDILVRTLSFPSGKNFFIREISSSMRTIHEEATTLFSMYLRGELDSIRRSQVESVIKRVKEDWLSRIEKSVTNVSDGEALPGKIFFTSDTDVSSFFIDILKSAKPELLITDGFDVQYLDQLIVEKFVSFGTEVIRDPFVVVEALFAEKILKQNL